MQYECSSNAVRSYTLREAGSRRERFEGEVTILFAFRSFFVYLQS